MERKRRLLVTNGVGLSFLCSIVVLYYVMSHYLGIYSILGGILKLRRQELVGVNEGGRRNGLQKSEFDFI